MKHALKSCSPRLRTVGVDVHVSQAAPEEFAQSFLGISYAVLNKTTLLKEIPTGALSNLPGIRSRPNTCLALGILGLLGVLRVWGPGVLRVFSGLAVHNLGLRAFELRV